MSHSQDARPPIVAAGAICWRERDGGIEVLIIHRPKYDDWSWPKGKQDRGESVPETAVRELQEEVGLRVTLGPPLATTTYSISRRRKDVYYWAAHVDPLAEAEPDGGEVDRLEWVKPSRARALLTNPTDAAPLDRLLELREAKDLRTRQIIVVRHAKAKPRSSWSRAEGERPLAATGKRQAVAVGRLLACWRPARVISSPWIRCMQTVAGYAQKYSVPVKEKNRLTEAAHGRKPEKVARLVHSLFDSSHSVVLCTHRPVLPTVLEALGRHCPKQLRAQLPSKDPYLSPGEMIVLNVSLKHRDRVISIEQVKPFDD
ncbi:NUDIX hydrolase [Rothia sp. AR01]|uniref:NUDIX hydrolase n=1 Tax=Rothia santali TaxID=2949643 RepID=A0A9X2HAR1_9MICC|nr:NUDIX hydrolase [Rothia santali]MCP3424755.1 NUDIX hydrolase [Rothia santali]